MLPPPQRIGDELVSGEKHIVGGLVGKVLRNDEVLDRTLTRALLASSHGVNDGDPIPLDLLRHYSINITKS